MSAESLIEIMMREAARAMPWGIMILVLILFSGMWLKQEAKEDIQFASQTMIRDVKAAALDPAVFVPLKRKVKEAIQYTAHTAIQEAKDAVLQSDTFVPLKHEVKKAIEYTATTAANQYVRAQRDLNGEQ